MQAFQLAYEELTRRGVRVAGISADTWATNAEFARASGITFPLLSDWPSYETMASFGVSTTTAPPSAQRTTFVVDALGVIRARIDDDVPAREHAARALDAVRALTG